MLEFSRNKTPFYKNETAFYLNQNGVLLLAKRRFIFFIFRENKMKAFDVWTERT